MTVMRPTKSVRSYPIDIYVVWDQVRCGEHKSKVKTGTGNSFGRHYYTVLDVGISCILGLGVITPHYVSITTVPILARGSHQPLVEKSDTK